MQGSFPKAFQRWKACLLRARCDTRFSRIGTTARRTVLLLHCAGAMQARSKHLAFSALRAGAQVPSYDLEHLVLFLVYEKMVTGKHVHAKRPRRLPAPRSQILVAHGRICVAAECGDRACERSACHVRIGFNQLEVGSEQWQKQLHEFLIV